MYCNRGKRVDLMCPIEVHVREASMVIPMVQYSVLEGFHGLVYRIPENILKYALYFDARCNEIFETEISYRKDSP